MDLDPWNWLLELEEEDLRDCVESKEKLEDLWNDFLDSCRYDPYDIEDFQTTIKRILILKQKDS